MWSISVFEKAKQNKLILLAGIALIIALVFEVFVCNINFFRNFSMSSPLDFGPENVVVENATYADGIISVTEQDARALIKLENINIPVSTIYLDMALIDENGARIDSDIEYKVFWTDEEETLIGRSFKRKLYSPSYTGQWIMTHFKGNVGDIQLDFKTNMGSRLRVNQICLNKRVPFEINLIRIVGLFIIIFLLISNETIKWLLTPLDHSKSEKVILFAYYLSLAFLVTFFFNASIKPGTTLNATEFDMYNKQLVDALEDGRCYLDFGIDLTKLSSVEQPYDVIFRAQNMDIDKDYMWDCAYYNGHLYCYYGVVPAILFFLPYHLITGNYLNTEITTYLGIVVFIIFATLLFYEFMKKSYGRSYCQRGLIMLVSAALLCGTTLMQFVTRATWYELVYAWGIALVALGLYLIITVGNSKWDNIKIFCGAVCLAAAVGCRPTMALFSFFLIPFIWNRIKLALNRDMRAILSLVMLVIPYVVIGILLMLYNYARFDSITEFGQTYQLTVTNNHFVTKDILSLPYEWWLACFRPMAIESEFPYVVRPLEPENYAGWFFYQKTNYALFAVAPFLYAVFVPKLWKEHIRCHGRRKTFCIGMILFSSVLIMSFALLSAGLGWRYKLEGAVILVFVVFILLANYFTNQFDDMTSWMRLLIVFVMISMFVGCMTSVNNEKFWIENNNHATYYALEHVLSFWK